MGAFLNPIEASIRQSSTLGMCLVDTSGNILEANDCLYSLLGRGGDNAPLSVGACFSTELADHARMSPGIVISAGLLRSDGQAVSVTVEILPHSTDDVQVWLVLPKETSKRNTAGHDGVAEISPAQLFECVHGGVAQSIAALAMNLHLVSLHDELPSSASARQLLQASIALVDQCSREVRSLSRLLRAAPPMSDPSRA